MKAGPDIAMVASLVGDPARSNMLSALMTGRALTASELAHQAGITPQTASSHLAKLEAGGLIEPEKQGRHRYYRLTGPDVAHVLEGLAGLAERAGHTRDYRHPDREAALVRRERVGEDRGRVRGEQRSADALQHSMAEALSAKGIEYRRLVRRTRAAIRESVPSDSTVLVVGKADSLLLNLRVKRASCFPQAADGSYAGFYPACSTSAIVRLEALRSKGSDFLIVPEISRWWLDHYGEFWRHLEQR